MQAAKKIFAILLCFTLLINIDMFVVNAEDSNAEASRQAAILESLGVLTESGGDFQSDVTRSEFAVALCNILGLGSLAKEGIPCDFDDVSTDDAASGYIKILSDLGLVDGVGDHKFHPRDSVTYNQAAKMLVSALGYTVYAENKGGYPTGYSLVANDLGILRGIEQNLETNINKGAFVQMLYNSLEVDLMTATGFGDDESYTIRSGETLLTEKLNAYRINGVVTGNHNTMLNGKSTLRKTEILIDDMVYQIGGGGDVDDLLGYNVDCYVQENTNSKENVILYIEQSEHKNNVVEVFAENISTNDSTERFKYWEENKRSTTPKTINISPRASAIYNGQAADYTVEDFNLDNGKITLIDNNGDNQYDVIIIHSYTTYIVNNVNADEKTVYTKFGASPLCFEGNNDQKVYFWKDGYDGYEVPIGNLKEWDVLSVAVSKDGSLSTVYISGNIPVRGSVKEIGQSEVTVDTQTLELTEEFINNTNMQKPALGEEGTFYLDFEGRVAAYERSADDLKVGYLLNANLSGGISEKTCFRILNASGKWTDYSGAKNINLNGTRRPGTEVLADDLLHDGTKIKHQLITYKLNDNDEVFVINTAQISGSNVLQPAYDVDSLDDVVRNFQYKSTAKKFGQYNVNSQTLIFGLPSEDDFDDPNAFSATALSDFVANTTYDVSLYYLSDSSRAKQLIDVLVYYKGTDGGKINDRARVGVVDKITSALNENGEQIQKIYLLYYGKEEIYVSKVGKKINGLAKGDVILFKELDGVLSSYKKLFSSKLRRTMVEVSGNLTESAALAFWYASDLNDVKGNENMINEDTILDANLYKFTDGREQAYFVLYGTVVHYDDGYVTIEKSDDPTFVRAFPFDSTNVYEYDLGTDKVSIGKKEDIAVGNQIVVKTNERVAIDALLIK